MDENNSNDNDLKVLKSFNSSQMADIISNNMKENESSRRNNNTNNDIANQESNPYMLENEEILPYSPEMLEDLLKSESKVSGSKNNTSEKIKKNEKKIKNYEKINNVHSHNINKNNIKNNNIKEKNRKEDNILSFEEIIKKRNKQKENTASIENNNKKINKINKNTINNKKEKVKEKENILSFEELLAQRTEESVNKSKDKSKDNEFGTNKKKKKLNIKIDFNGRLYQQKKNYQKLKEEKENEEKKVNSIKKYSTKSQKKPNKKIKLFSEEKEKKNNFQNAIGFEYFMNKKGKEELENKSKENKNRDRTKSTNKSRENKSKSKEKNQENNMKKNNKNNTKIINDFLNRNVPKKKEKEDIRKPNQIIQIRKKKQINKGHKRKENSENIIDFKIFKKDNSERNFYFINPNSRLYNSNQKQNSKRKESAKKNKQNNIRKFRRMEVDDDRGVPLGVTEAEINLAMKNKEFGKNIQKRFSPIQDNLINFDNSKFAKYDTEQIRYGLIKDYSNIRPNKDDKFLQRMQFESLKRKNQDEKINELVEKNKHKINEAELERTFNRLVDDANRRFIEKQGLNDIDKEKEKENDKELDKDIISFKDLEVSSPKKYSEEEWDEIYNKRFKNYDEYKKKRLEIKREKEKIEKMIEEEEQIKLCKIKKVPEEQIRDNTQRLYDEAKKREIIKKRKMTVPKSAKNYFLNKDNIFLNSFNDEEDASKYMKSYKSETYNFFGNNENNNNLNNDNNNYYSMSMYYNNENNHKPRNLLNNDQIYNEGKYSKLFNNKNIYQKFNNMFITEGNNRKLNQRKNNDRIRDKIINCDNYPFSENKNYINNHTFDNKYRDFPKYNDFKKNKLQKGINMIRINTNANTINSLQFQYGYNNFIDNKLNCYNNYRNASEYINEQNEANCRENIVDKYLYNYCINKYFNQSSLN